MENIVDARGLSCPQPVINTKKILEQLQDENSLVTIVDNEIAKDNVIKLAENYDCKVEVERKKEDFHITITKAGEIQTQLHSQNKDVVFLSSRYMGRGDEKLGDILMKSFLYSLSQSNKLPGTVILMNSGVKLAVEESEVLEHLISLDKKGVEVIVCGTCLDYYEIKDKLCVGTISNMYSILEYLMAADKVLSC